MSLSEWASREKHLNSQTSKLQGISTVNRTGYVGGQCLPIELCPIAAPQISDIDLSMMEREAKVLVGNPAFKESFWYLVRSWLPPQGAGVSNR